MQLIRLSLLSCLLVLSACDSGQLTVIDGSGGPAGDGGATIDGITCGAVSRKAELPPLDMLIALDTSYSMDFLGKWLAVKEALKTFATDPKFASIGVGLQYFPLRAQCKVADYAQPAVAIAPLSQVSQPLIDSLDAQQMFGGTPMVPTLQGAMEYIRSWATAKPERKVAIVLATDGIPDDTCHASIAGSLPNTLANVVKVAGEGVAAKPRVVTFVIGVGSELTALDQISIAGGTGNAFLVDTSKNIKQEFLDALNDIRRTMACEYNIPPPPSGEVGLDFDEVNVQFTTGSSSETFLRVKDKVHCASSPGNGWYYDDPDEPSKIILCEDACRKVQSADEARIDVLFGCETQVA